MAITQLADIKYNPKIYADYMRENRPDKDAYFRSGVAVTNPTLEDRIDGGSDSTTLPFWLDLDASSENISSDDPNAKAIPDKITSGELRARRRHLNKSWQVADLVKDVTAEDGMQEITLKTARYWEQREAKAYIAITTGVYLANVANNAGDMVFDIASEDGDNASAANKWSFDGFVDARATMGENAEKMSMLAVHPHTMAQMQKQGRIAFIQDKDTGLRIPFYNEYRVVEDKKMPVIAGATSGLKYLSVLYGRGFFGVAHGFGDMPVEVEREAAAGNGAGIETLYERRKHIIHPAAHDWKEATVSAHSPTIADLSLAANWERKYDRENCPIAFFVHN